MSLPGQPSVTLMEGDKNLFIRLKNDPTVVGEVYDLYADKLYGFLLKRCGQKELAEDLVSQTFVKLLEQTSKLEYRDVSLGAWLYQVASNALTDHYRKASTKRDTQFDTDEWDPPADSDTSWFATVNFDGEQLRGCIIELSERDQQVLDLRFFGGFEIPEIAERLEVSANHASVLVYRAIGRLRQVYLKKYPSAV